MDTLNIINNTYNTIITEAGSKKASERNNDSTVKNRQPGPLQDYIDISVNARMTSRLNGLIEASENLKQADDLLDTALNGLDEISRRLDKIQALAKKSSNTAFSQKNRLLFQIEISSLIKEIDQISSSTKYNEMTLLDGRYTQVNPKASMWFQLDTAMHRRERIFISTITAKSLMLKNPSYNQIPGIKTPEDAKTTLLILKSSKQRLQKTHSNIEAYKLRFSLAKEKNLEEAKHILKNEDTNLKPKEIEEIKKRIKDLETDR